MENEKRELREKALKSYSDLSYACGLLSALKNTSDTDAILIDKASLTTLLDILFSSQEFAMSFFIEREITNDRV